MTAIEGRRVIPSHASAISSKTFRKDIITPSIAEKEFLSYLSDVGIVINECLVGDGAIHRYHNEGDTKGSRNISIAFHNDQRPAGYFKNFKTDISGTWSLNGMACKLTEADWVKIERGHARVLKEKEALYLSNAMMAERLCAGATQAFRHGYLTTKGINSCRGLLVTTKGELLVPVFDLDDKIWSVQRIFWNRHTQKYDKRFLSGCRTSGGSFRINGDDVLGVCEGIATGISLRRETGHTIFCAFGSGNLLKVARGLRERHPSSRIILFGDNDAHTKGNPGVAKATEAATAIRADLAIPPIVGDWNDFLDGVKDE